MENLDQLNNPTTTATNSIEQDETQRLAWTIAQAADDRKAGDIVILDVVEVSYLADYFIIATGYSRTQVRAISDAIQEKVEKEFNLKPLRIEGQAQRSWIVQDYGDAIVHVLLPEERQFYNIEAFWGHAQRIEFDSVRAEAS